MNIIDKPIDAIKPYANNPRHNDDAVKAVAISIQQFGFKVPIVIDQNGVIVTGHTRLKAAKQLGLDTVPVIVADDLTDEQIRAFRIADNKVSEAAEWDELKLAEELQAIEDAFTGFDDREFERLMNAIAPELTEDEYDDETPTEPLVQFGQRWQLGNHILMCGDSTKEEDVRRLMGGALADLVCTDPPYNVAYEGGTEDKLTIANDNLSDLEFKKFCENFSKQAYLFTKPGGVFYVWLADIERLNFQHGLESAGFAIKQQLIWVKNQFTIGRQDYQHQAEPCLYGWKPGAGHYFIDDRSFSTVFDDASNLNKMTKSELIAQINALTAGPATDVIRENKPSRNGEHPTMKPVRLIGRLIANSSRFGESVLDLFGGSGTTLIACEQLNRKCYMMEYDPKYCDVIIGRWEKLTGGKAVLLDD